MKQEHINEIKAIVIFAFGLLLFISFISFHPEDLSWYTSNPSHPVHNFISTTGAYLSSGFNFILGYSSYVIVLFFFFWSWNYFVSRELKFTLLKLFSFAVLLVVASSLLSLIGPAESIYRFERGGLIGFLVGDFLLKNLGFGAYVILFCLGALALIVTGEFLITPLLMMLFLNVKNALTLKAQRSATDDKKNIVPKPKINLGVGKIVPDKSKAAVSAESAEKKEERINKILEKGKAADLKAAAPLEKEKEPQKPPQIRIAKMAEDGSSSEKEEPKIVGEYQIPSFDLLDDPPQVSTAKIQDGLINEAQLLETTLANFGVDAKVVDIERGPAITRYELEPAPGVKVQKFTTLDNDIALAMRAATVRIVAPIPGKNRIGIEVPNSASAAVYFKEVLSTPQFKSAKSKLALCLGKDISGAPMVADLAQMPHLLIAGTTGSGKSVCVNGIIMSMLMNSSPDEVKFIMVDPKMVEMALYNEIPHLLSPTIIDPKKAAVALNWVVTEMENRYTKLSKEGVKNIAGYHAKGFQMPYIVLIIDELADLMQVSAKAVESSITRIAQLSRAVGIHMILATQRPSVDVITGVIKANFPARISFKVASKIDSRTVLDMNGAEALLGRGDMLFIQPGDAKPSRGQCSFVKDEEINRVIDFIKKQRTPFYNDTILQQQKSGATGGSEDQDEYYDEAVRLVVETNQASVSILQRRLRLGYTRAARLIDMMEQQGVVGPYVGSKAREILVDREQWLLDNMKNKEAPKEESHTDESRQLQ